MKSIHCPGEIIGILAPIISSVFIIFAQKNLSSLHPHTCLPVFTCPSPYLPTFTGVEDRSHHLKLTPLYSSALDAFTCLTFPLPAFTLPPYLKQAADRQWRWWRQDSSAEKRRTEEEKHLHLPTTTCAPLAALHATATHLPLFYALLPARLPAAGVVVARRKISAGKSTTSKNVKTTGNGKKR